MLILVENMINGKSIEKNMQFSHDDNNRKK